MARNYASSIGNLVAWWKYRSLGALVRGSIRKAIESQMYVKGAGASARTYVERTRRLASGLVTEIKGPMPGPVPWSVLVWGLVAMVAVLAGLYYIDHMTFRILFDLVLFLIGVLTFPLMVILCVVAFTAIRKRPFNRSGPSSDGADASDGSDGDRGGTEDSRPGPVDLFARITLLGILDPAVVMSVP